MRVASFTERELKIIKDSIGSLVDITDDELDDPRNQHDPDVSRAKMLKEREEFMVILDKINRHNNKPPRVTTKRYYNH